MGLSAKYILSVDAHGQRHWKAVLDNNTFSDIPVGYSLEFPAAIVRRGAEDTTVNYAIGTVVTIEGPDQAEKLEELKERLIAGILEKDPSLDREAAKRVIQRFLLNAKPSDFSDSIVKGGEEGA